MRNMLMTGLVLAVALTAAAQDELTVLREAQDGHVPPGGLLYAYLQEQAHQALERRLQRYEQIKTPENVAAYQKDLKAFFIEQLGGFPERTPLNARTAATLYRDVSCLSKIIFDSRLGFHATRLSHLLAFPPPYSAVRFCCRLRSD